jgi:3-mercaptopyruvate sulfurtransferase SseA
MTCLRHTPRARPTPAALRQRGLGLLLALVAVAGLAPAAVSQTPSTRSSAITAADVPRMTIDTLKKRLAARDVVVVDVRGSESYRAGHIPGAVSIPYDEMDQHVNELRAWKKTIVTYCA